MSSRFFFLKFIKFNEIWSGFLFKLLITHTHLHLLPQINVSEIVREMRLQRHGMIQTKVSKPSL